MIDLTTGEDSLRNIDPDEVVLMDPDEKIDPVNEGIAVIRTEEIWYI